MGSYPSRPYGWRVILSSGAVVEEFPEEGPPANRWDELDLDAIEELELVSVGLVREPDPVVRWELGRADLWIRGRRVDVVLGPHRLTGSPGELVEPLQKKKASSTYRPGQGSTQRLHGFLIGCHRRLGEGADAPVRVLAKVDPEGGVGLRVDAPKPLSEHSLTLLVDGEPVRSSRELHALVGPPLGGDAPCP